VAAPRSPISASNFAHFAPSLLVLRAALDARSAFQNTETRLNRDDAVVVVSDPPPKPTDGAANVLVSVDEFLDLVYIRPKIPDRIGDRVNRVPSRDHFAVGHDSEQGSNRNCVHVYLPSHKDCRLNRLCRSDAPIPEKRRCGQAAADVLFSSFLFWITHSEAGLCAQVCNLHIQGLRASARRSCSDTLSTWRKTRRKLAPHNLAIWSSV
jgi:hypothetical protein